MEQAHITLTKAAPDTIGLGFSNLPYFIWFFVEMYGSFLAMLMGGVNALVYGSKDNYNYKEYYHFGFDQWYDIIVLGVLM
jgi:hypothetical protein